MQAAYSVVAGIDVHKRVLMAVVARADSAGVPFAEGKFITTRSGLEELKQWLSRHGAEAAVMESTAQYWWPVWLELESNWALFLAQARSNAAPQGRKTDFRDAARLVRRYFSGDLRFSFVPPPEQRAWRRLARTWKGLGEEIVEARNEIEAVLEEGQIKLACVVSDLLGASGRRVLKALAEGESAALDLARLCDRRVRKSEQERVDALSGQLPEAHRLVLRQHLERIELLDRQRAELQSCLEGLMREQAPAVRRLAEVPGMNIVAAQHLIAEIGPSGAAFPSPQQFIVVGGCLSGQAGECRNLDKQPVREGQAVRARSDLPDRACSDADQGELLGGTFSETVAEIGPQESTVGGGASDVTAGLEAPGTERGLRGAGATADGP